jgi:hypothetical protein
LSTNAAKLGTGEEVPADVAKAGVVDTSLDMDLELSARASCTLHENNAPVQPKNGNREVAVLFIFV